MSNQDQTPPSGEGHQAPPPVVDPDKQAHGPAEIQPIAPEHDKKPETAHDEPSTPKTGTPS